MSSCLHRQPDVTIDLRGSPADEFVVDWQVAERDEHPMVPSLRDLRPCRTHVRRPDDQVRTYQ